MDSCIFTENIVDDLFGDLELMLYICSAKVDFVDMARLSSEIGVMRESLIMRGYGVMCCESDVNKRVNCGCSSEEFVDVELENSQGRIGSVIDFTKIIGDLYSLSVVRSFVFEWCEKYLGGAA